MEGKRREKEKLDFNANWLFFSVLWISFDAFRICLSSSRSSTTILLVFQHNFKLILGKQTNTNFKFVPFHFSYRWKKEFSLVRIRIRRRWHQHQERDIMKRNWEKKSLKIKYGNFFSECEWMRNENWKVFKVY